jgi:cell division initiation protein
MVQQANKDAELQVREAQMQAEAILNDANNQARDLIDESEMRAREISGELRDDLKKLENDYRTLESYRDNLISEMKTFANGTLDRLENQNFQKVDFASIMKSTNKEFESKVSKEPLFGEKAVEVKEESFVSQEVELEIEGEVVEDAAPKEIEVFEASKSEISEEQNSEPSDEESEEKTGGSFFDSLG